MRYMYDNSWARIITDEMIETIFIEYPRKSCDHISFRLLIPFPTVEMSFPVP